VAYSPNAPELGWRDFLFMARRKLLNLGGRFFPYLPIRLQCLRMAGVLLGRNVYIGEDLIISEILEDRHPHIIIGDRVAIAQRVTIVTASNPNYSHLSKFFEGIQGRVEIQDDAWVGAGAIILPNVTIGRGAIVAAGAVVAESVSEYTVVGGVPARIIRKIDVAVKPSLARSAHP